jgi:hypothetical protein
MAEITDPDLLKQLGAPAAPSGLVTDPDLLRQLNAKETPEQAEAIKKLPDVGAPLIPSGPTLPGNPTVNDIANSASTGAMKGVIAGLGTPGDASNLLAKGSKIASDYISDKIGFDQPSDKAGIAPSIFPTSSDIQNAVERGRGKFYEPQTPGGRFTEKATEFATNPFSYLGPGSTLAKAGTAIGSGLGAEAGRELTENSSKPWVQAAGPLLGAIAGGHLTPGPTTVTNAAPGSRLADVATLQRAGIRSLSAGDITGNKNLRVAESQLSSKLNEAQDKELKQAAFRIAGEDIGDRAIKGQDGAVNTMMNRSGNQFDTLGARNTLHADPQLATDLTDVYRTYNGIPGLYPQETVNAVNGAAGRVQQVIQQGGVMSGPEYLTLRSSLRRAAMGATDPQRAEGLHDVTNALDSAMERSVQANNPADAGAFSQAFRNYRNALVLQDWSGAANMTPATLAQSAKKIYGKNQYTKGMDDFSELAEAARNVMKQYPDSGTASRASVEKALSNLGGMLTHAISGGGGLVAGHHFLGGPDPGVEGLLLGESVGPFVLKPAARMALMNPLTQSAIAKQTSPNTIALMNAIRGNQAPPTVTRDGQQRLYVSPPAK